MITGMSEQNKIVSFVYKQYEQLVNISDIEYIEADEWLCRICTYDREIICAKRLKHLQSIFEKYGFVRCHKGYIVNLAKAAKLTSAKITLKSGKTIPLGRTYKNIVRREFERIV